MPTAFLIPTTPESQTFKVVLAGVTYSVSLNWSEVASAWVLDLADASGIPILSGLTVVAGTDLLSPYLYMNFGGSLVAATSGDITQPPTFDNLGSTGNLYFITP